MTNNLTILLLLISSLLKAQRDVKVFKEDFDGDGNIEELVVNSYLGEVDFALLTYDDGLKKCTLNIRPQKKHPSLINTVPLCNDLLLPKYKRFTNFVVSLLKGFKGLIYFLPSYQNYKTNSLILLTNEIE